MTGNPWAYEGQVSPNGQWMAYMSNESGHWEVFLTRYPSCEGKWQVSTGGAQWPRWDASNRLYYVESDRITMVDVTPGSASPLGSPTVLFTRPATVVGSFSQVPAFGVTRDGQRFLLTRVAGAQQNAEGPTIVQSWLAEFAAAKK